MSLIHKFQKKIIFLLPILSCFDAYCITYIGTFPLTISFLAIILLLFLSLINFQDKNSMHNIIILIFFFFILFLSFISNNIDINSTLLYVMLFLTYLITNNTLTNLELYFALKKFLLIVSLLSIFAIFQFLSNFSNIPRIDIIIPNHMVLGYNTGNYVYIGNFEIFRSHSIYLEPSTLSQYTAFAIIISFILHSNKMIGNLFLILSISLNGIALICSISGTGLIILGVSIIIYFFKNFRYKKVKKILLCFLITLIIAIGILPLNIKKYIFDRILEIFNPQLSGGMRFTYPYIIMFKSWLVRPLGFSPGNEMLAILEFQPEMLELQLTLASGYAKLGVELGIFGLLLFLIMILSNKKNRNIYFISFLLLINFIGGNLLNPFFWSFAIFFKSTNYNLHKIKQK